MRSARRLAPAVTLVLGLAACEDARNQPVAPTAPAAAPDQQSALMPDLGPNAALALEQQITSICKAYRKAGAQLKHDLVKNPDDAQLLAESKAIKEMTDEACN